MNMKIQAINEEERNINWEEVEWKIAIICNKFRTSVEPRYIDDLAQELRIHAYYKSDDYYDLQRKAIDFWRSMRVNVMPEVPYFDLEFLGRTKEDDTSFLEFESLVKLIREELNVVASSKFKNEIRMLAIKIFDIIVADIDYNNPKDVKNSETYPPYHNGRISCSYLWDVLQDDPQNTSYARIRKAVKMIESTVKELGISGKWSIDDIYLN